MNNLYRNNVYDSNCICFWAPVTSVVHPNIIENRYWVNTFGQIWDSYSQRYIIPTCNINTKWYEYTHFASTTGKNITRKVHRVVMLTFMYFAGCEKYEVNHLDGNHSNNYIFNLEWATGSINRIHAIKSGLEDTIFGKPIVKLTEDEVHQIKILRDRGLSYEAIIDTIGIRERGAGRKLIEKIVHGKSKLYSQFYY